MRISDSCAACLYDKQVQLTDNEAYLEEIRGMLEERRDEVTAPHMVYLFSQVYERYFGKKAGYEEQKKTFNDLALSMEPDIRRQILAAEDPLKQALFLARTGNYIDFGAMNHVDTATFMTLLENLTISENDAKTYDAFLTACSSARKFLLLADNCGEIVFDKLLVEQLHARFPQMEIYVMVRAAEVLNDVTPEDAAYVGIDRVATVLTNGTGVAGTVYDLLPETSKAILDSCDVILSKGQGNYETFANQGRHAFYLLLCKCDMFTERFEVPRLTGVFVEE